MASRPRTAEAEAFLVAFGCRIRELRCDRGLSQERLGELTGIDRQTVNRLENASHALSTAHLGALAKALRVPASCLVPQDDGGDRQIREPVDNSPVQPDPYGTVIGGAAAARCPRRPEPVQQHRPGP